MALGFIRRLWAAALSAGGLVSVALSGGRNPALVGRRNRGMERGSKRAPQGDPSGICALGTLAEGFQPARLETRTKESNMYASRWVENP